MQVGDPITEARELRQGDIVSFAGAPDGSDGHLDTPFGVAVLTQTCDLIQANKLFCIIAPVSSSDPDALSRARRGQTPLRLYLPAVGNAPAQIADMERMTSVPNERLAGATLLSRRVESDQDTVGRNVAARIGRAFTRFPFPDGIHDAFAKLQSKARKTSAESAFGRVLERVLEFRLATEDWSAPCPSLTLHIVVSDDVLILAADADEEWSWDPSAVASAKQGERLETMNVTRVSEILLANLEAASSNIDSVDPTTLLRLWERWTAALERELLRPAVESGIVGAFSPSLVSESEFTLADWNRSESLDLEILSDSTASIS